MRDRLTFQFIATLDDKHHNSTMHPFVLSCAIFFQMFSWGSGPLMSFSFAELGHGFACAFQVWISFANFTIYQKWLYQTYPFTTLTTKASCVKLHQSFDTRMRIIQLVQNKPPVTVTQCAEKRNTEQRTIKILLICRHDIDRKDKKASKLWMRKSILPLQ